MFLKDPYENRPNNRYGQIFNDIREGKPPATKPENVDKDEDVIWYLLESCWERNPKKRPTARVFLRLIQSISLIDQGPSQSRDRTMGRDFLRQPRYDHRSLYYFFLHYTPSANLAQPNILSDNDALSELCYALVTTPESTHGWVVFKFFHEDILKVRGGADIWTAPQSSSFTFPSSPLHADISKTVKEFWNTLKPSEAMEWAELAHDIRNAYKQLMALFGNGLTFDGNDWEKQRHYHARALYFKWEKYQATDGTAS